MSVRINKIPDYITHLVCRICKENKPLDEMVLNRTTVSKKMGCCKICHSKRNTNIHYKKELKKNPEKYGYCDDCDATFVTRRTNKKLHDVTFVFRTCCPKCKSTNIGRYSI